MNGQGHQLGDDCRAFWIEGPLPTDISTHIRHFVEEGIDNAPEEWKKPACYRVLIDIYLHRNRCIHPGHGQGVDLDNPARETINAFDNKKWFWGEGDDAPYSDDKYIVEILMRKIRVEETGQEGIRVIIQKCSPIDKCD